MTNPARNIRVAEREPQTMLSIIRERFMEHRAALCGVFVILFFISVALLAPLISKWTGLDPTSQDILGRYGPWSREHWFGTDESGRDFFIRLVYGTRVSLGVAFVSA